MSRLNYIVRPLTSFFIAVLLVMGSISSTANAQSSADYDAVLLATIQELTRIVAALQLQIAGGTGTTPVPTSLPQMDFFTAPVVQNATNESVRLLQSILKTDPAIYPEGITSGLFGPLTLAALQRFQAAYGLPANGMFTTETEAILNSVLRSIPLSTYSFNYLLQLPVQTRLASAADEYVLVNTLNTSGVVVLREDPIFSATIKSTDTATLQRILRTDVKIYPEGRISGLMDPVTAQAVIRLRIKYGIPYVIPSNGVINMANLMNTLTTELVRDILAVNNSGVVRNDLLLLAAVQPIVLISNSTRDLAVVQATRNYRTNMTQVRVNYEGGTVEEFVINTVSPRSSVAQAIATRLDRSVSAINDVIVHDELYGDDFRQIVLTVTLINDMSLDITYMNNSTEQIIIGPQEIAGFVGYLYGGDMEAYRADFNYYVERARNGESLDDLNQVWADILGIPVSEVAAVMVYDVEQYLRGGEENGTGGA